MHIDTGCTVSEPIRLLLIQCSTVSTLIHIFEFDFDFGFHGDFFLLLLRVQFFFRVRLIIVSYMNEKNKFIVIRQRKPDLMPAGLIYISLQKCEVVAVI